MSGEVDDSVRNDAPSGAAEARQRLILSNECIFFMSHAGDQKESLVRFIFDELKRHGQGAFLDDFSLKAGDDSPVVMRRALRTCPAVVFVLTPEFVAKEATMQELKFALQLQELQPVFKAFLWKFRKTLGKTNRLKLQF